MNRGGDLIESDESGGAEHDVWLTSGGKATNDTCGVAEKSLMSARYGNSERSLHEAARSLL